MDSESGDLDEVLPLSPHSDWHDSSTTSGGTDFDTADWVVMDDASSEGSSRQSEDGTNTPSLLGHQALLGRMNVC